MAAYYFPPLGGSGVFRSIKFAKYLPQFHWWPTVISTDCPPLEMSWVDGSLVQEIPAGMQVIRILEGRFCDRRNYNLIISVYFPQLLKGDDRDVQNPPSLLRQISAYQAADCGRRGTARRFVETDS